MLSKSIELGGDAVKQKALDGDGSEVFMLDALSAGNTITLGKALKQGRAWVEVSDTLPATPENCKIYSETAGMNVTPHPVWGLPKVQAE